MILLGGGQCFLSIESSPGGSFLSLSGAPRPLMVARWPSSTGTTANCPVQPSNHPVTKWVIQSRLENLWATLRLGPKFIRTFFKLHAILFIVNMNRSTKWLCRRHYRKSGKTGNAWSFWCWQDRKNDWLKFVKVDSYNKSSFNLYYEHYTT